MIRSRFVLAPITLAALTACQRGAPGGGAAKAAPRPVPVSVAQAAEGASPIIVRTVGNVEPIASVTLRPQVAGQIQDLPEAEGSDVPAGRVIVVLDARPFDAALGSAQAALARDRVMAADAHLAAEQYSSAALANAMPKRTSEEAEAKAAAADATVAADEAAVRTAKLNLDYCTIAAPFAGRLGSFKVKRGAIVKENETDLIELVQIAPIQVSFSVPEDRLPLIQKGRSTGPLPVSALIPGDDSTPAAGSVTFVDNRVDPATGTIRLKATFENADRRLWPGQFINTTLTLGREERVVLVPSEAVQNSQDGASVFVVKPDNTAELRTVATGRAAAGMTVIAKGVSAGETVVTDGQLRLAPGMQVEIKPVTSSAPSKPAAAASVDAKTASAK